MANGASSGSVNRAVLSGVVTVFVSRSKAISELGKIGKPNSTNPKAKRRM
jgi:hypothetical protein